MVLPTPLSLMLTDFNNQTHHTSTMLMTDETPPIPTTTASKTTCYNRIFVHLIQTYIASSPFHYQLHFLRMFSLMINDKHQPKFLRY